MMYAIDNEDDFAGIFVEEAEGVFETLDHRLALWRKLPSDKDALAEIRRGFHTLKGSGRMVNALDLAEVAWKVENMLNCVIDGSIQVTEPLIELVSTVRGLMPRMLEAFKNQRSIGSDLEVEALMAQADALAAGKTPAPVRAQPTAATPTPGGKRNVALEVVKLSHKLESVRKRADESLHRSEMALQHARRFGTHVSAIKGEVLDLVGRAEVSPVIEQVDLLAKEVQTLRRDSQQEQLPQRRELNQLVDQLVRERLAPMQRRRGELERQLDEALRASNASRSLARLAMILSSLLGTAAIAALTISGLIFG